MEYLRKIRKISAIIAFLVVFFASFEGLSAKNPKKARFYDFSDQLINGEVKKPTTIYFNTRTRAKFKKLLNLKKSFRGVLIQTNQDPILK